MAGGVFSKGLQGAYCSKCGKSITEGYLYLGASNKIVCSECNSNKIGNKKVSITIKRITGITGLINSFVGVEAYFVSSSTNIIIKDRILTQKQVDDYINNPNYNVRIA